MQNNFQTTAFFVRQPFRIENLLCPHLPNQRQPFVIEKTIDLAGIDYENLITDLTVDRRFIEKNKRLCRVDQDGVWHCLLVRQRGKTDGVLIMPEGTDYPKFAAYYPGEEAGEE
jgi:hypothetical protein